MSAFSIGRFSWLPSPWQQTQAWRDRQSQLQGDFEAATGAAASTLATAATNLSSGRSSLAIKVGTKAAQARAQARAASKANVVNKLV
jgi:hypothetical protein